MSTPSKGDPLRALDKIERLRLRLRNERKVNRELGRRAARYKRLYAEERAARQALQTRVAELEHAAACGATNHSSTRHEDAKENLAACATPAPRPVAPARPSSQAADLPPLPPT